MGISADLIYFTEYSDKYITDLDESITLYELLPRKLYSLITHVIEESYDIDYYRNLYADPDLEISIIHPDNSIELSNNITIPESEVKTIQVKGNKICYNTVQYIGGSSAFVPNIYELYNNKIDYPYLWHVSQVHKLITDHDTLARIEYSSTNIDPDLIYINLNY